MHYLGKIKSNFQQFVWPYVKPVFLMLSPSPVEQCDPLADAYRAFLCLF